METISAIVPPFHTDSVRHNATHEKYQISMTVEATISISGCLLYEGAYVTTQCARALLATLFASPHPLELNATTGPPTRMTTKRHPH